MPVFSAAIVLLLSIWSAKRSGMSFNYQKEMDEVYKCMKALKSTERQCVMFILYLTMPNDIPPPGCTLLVVYGTLLVCPFVYVLCSTDSRDILYELASAGELPLPRSPANKRELDMDSPKSSEAGSSPAMSGIETPDMSHRPIIKNKRVSATYQQQPTFAIPTGPELCQPLPMSTFGAQYNEFHSQFLTSHMPAYTNQGPSTPSLNPMDAYRWNQAPDVQYNPTIGEMFSGGNGGGGGFGPLQTHNGYDIHGAAQPYHATHGDVPAPSTSASALLDTEAMSMWPTGFECVYSLFFDSV